jgi:hypothetical protein
MSARLTIDDTRCTDGRRSAVLTVHGHRSPLWIERLHAALDPAACADPFVLASMFVVMRAGSDLHVEGQVSATLLQNLADWQDVWKLWNRGYAPVAISADEVVPVTRTGRGGIVCAFSGGLDSTYSAYRHLHPEGRAGVRPRISAAVLVHGADIPLSDERAFDSARTRAEKMLAGAGVPLVAMRTNVRALLPDWHDGHGAAIAACLTALAPEYELALLPSSDDYAHLHWPWGTHPATDHLMSTGGMAIRTDGAGASRTEKAAAVATWPEAARWIRVCWQGAQLDRNCGRCEKCVRTILNFRAAGAGLPGCFDRDVSDAAIASIRLDDGDRVEMEYILRHCEAAGVSGTWVAALRHAVRRSRVRQAVLRPVRRYPQVHARVLALRSAWQRRSVEQTGAGCNGTSGSAESS